MPSVGCSRNYGDSRSLSCCARERESMMDIEPLALVARLAGNITK